MDLLFTYPQLILPVQRETPWSSLYVPSIARSYALIKKIAPAWSEADLTELQSLLPRTVVQFDAIDNADQRQYGSLDAESITVPYVGNCTDGFDNAGYKKLIRAGFGPQFAIMHSAHCYDVLIELDEQRQMWSRYRRFTVRDERITAAYMNGVNINLLKEANHQQYIETEADIPASSVGGQRLNIPTIPSKAETRNDRNKEVVTAHIQWSTGYTEKLIKNAGVGANILNAEMAQARLIGSLLIALLNRDSEILGLISQCSSSIVSWCLLVSPSGGGKTPIHQAISPLKTAVETVIDARATHRKYLKAITKINHKKQGDTRLIIEEAGFKAPTYVYNTASMASHDNMLVCHQYWRKDHDPLLAPVIHTIGVLPNYGFTLITPEASALFGSLNNFNQTAVYATGRLVSFWGNHEGGTALRRSDKTTTGVTNGSLNIIGGIQDSFFAKLLLADAAEGGRLGLTARFILIPLSQDRSKRQRNYVPPATEPIDLKLLTAIAEQGQRIKRWVFRCPDHLIDKVERWITDCEDSGHVPDKVFKYHENLMRSALAFECCEMLNRAAAGLTPINTNDHGYGVISSVAVERALELMKISHETHVRLLGLGNKQALNAEVNRIDRAEQVRNYVSASRTYNEFIKYHIEDHVRNVTCLGFREVGTAYDELTLDVKTAATELNKEQELLGLLKNALKRHVHIQT